MGYNCQDSSEANGAFEKLRLLGFSGLLVEEENRIVVHSNHGLGP